MTNPAIREKIEKAKADTETAVKEAQMFNEAATFIEGSLLPTLKAVEALTDEYGDQVLPIIEKLGDKLTEPLMNSMCKGFKQGIVAYAEGLIEAMEVLHKAGYSRDEAITLLKRAN